MLREIVCIVQTWNGQTCITIVTLDRQYCVWCKWKSLKHTRRSIPFTTCPLNRSTKMLLSCFNCVSCSNCSPAKIKQGCRRHHKSAAFDVSLKSKLQGRFTLEICHTNGICLSGSARNLILVHWPYCRSGLGCLLIQKLGGGHDAQHPALTNQKADGCRISPKWDCWAASLYDLQRQIAHSLLFWRNAPILLPPLPQKAWCHHSSYSSALSPSANGSTVRKFDLRIRVA